jgi:hypothetical protein
VRPQTEKKKKTDRAGTGRASRLVIPWRRGTGRKGSPASHTHTRDNTVSQLILGVRCWSWTFARAFPGFQWARGRPVWSVAEPSCLPRPSPRRQRHHHLCWLATNKPKAMGSIPVSRDIGNNSPIHPVLDLTSISIAASCDDSGH